jgi:hypothetical protein
MNENKDVIKIDGIDYVRKDSIKSNIVGAKKVGNMPYVIVRTYSAGVFAGYLKSRKGKEVTMINVRRLWYWDGAASLSQLAVDGTSKPQNCKFPAEVSQIELTEVIEVLQVTEKAKKSISEVKIWQQ